MYGRILVSLSAAAVLATSVSAATIIDTTDTPGTGSFTLGNFSTDQDPLGVVFSLTAESENLIAGGFVTDANANLAPELSVTLSIYEGVGFAGTFIGSVTNVLSDGFAGITMADFSLLGTFAAGDYTLGFSSGGTGRGALATTTGGEVVDVNEEGVIDWPTFSIVPRSLDTDFAAIVTADVVEPAPIPLPASVLLLGAGLAGFGVMSRRKKA